MPMQTYDLGPQGEAGHDTHFQINTKHIANIGELYQGQTALFLSHGTVSGGALALTRHRVQRVVLGANTAFAAPSSPASGDQIQVSIVQDGTGNRLATWPSSATWKWPSAVPAVLSAAAGAEDVVSATYDGASWKAVISKAFG